MSIDDNIDIAYLYCAPSGRRIQSVQKYLSECFKINEERPRRVLRHLGYIVGYL